MGLFFCLFVFHWGYLAKKYFQKCGLQKEIKKGRDRYIETELPVEGGLNFLETETMFYVNNGNYE